MCDVFQLPMHGTKFFREKLNVTLSHSPRQVQGNDRLAGAHEIYQNAAETLKRVACVRYDDDIHNVQPACSEKGKSIADEGAHVGLQVSRAVTGVYIRRPPNFDGENVKRAQEGAGIVNRQHRCDESASILLSADDFRTTRNGGEHLVYLRGLILAQKREGVKSI
jgi:hypothetical protein